MEPTSNDSGRPDLDEQTKRPGRVSAGLARMAIGASILVAAVLVGGFAYATYAAMGGVTGNHVSASGPQAGQSVQAPSSKGKALHLLALGDSLTHGFGDASGRGYVGDVSRQYRQQGYAVIESNLGVDGLTSSGLLSTLKQPSVRTLVQSANTILISIGGNDLNDAAGLPNLNAKRIATAQADFHRNLAAILSNIRTLNTTAPIVIVGLYNPYGDDAATRQRTDAIIRTWGVEEQQLTAAFPQTVVAQTFDLFQLHPSQFLYIDHFHPNQTGYQRISDRIWQDLQGF